MVEKQDLHSHFQAKRLIQIFWGVEFTLLFVFIQRLYLGSFYYAYLTALVAFILIGVHFLAKSKKIIAAATFLLFTITLLATYFMWENSGIYDEALLAYPCILIMTAMIGERKLFLSLLVFMSFSILLNGLSNQQDWYINPVQAVNFDSALLVVVIIWLTSFTVWVMSSDFHSLVNKLSHENTEVVSSKKEIEKLLHHDILTGLPNRMMAQDIFNKAVAKASKEDSDVYLMFIDLDNFKLINDGIGHQAGDALLKELATRFKKTVRDSDAVCRFAGDEFLIILEATNTDEFIRRIARSIIKEIQTPYYHQSNELICSCSIGIAASSKENSDFDSVIQNADTAMYHSKSIGGNSFHFFDAEMESQGNDYLNIVSDLRKALKEDQFILHFQPKFNLLNDKIIGAEALIRWNHPEKGLIYPDFFIPQAEKSGLIVEIGEWVLESSCKACKEWIDLGFIDFSIAVNVSSQQFKRGSFAKIVQNALMSSGLTAKHLEIEMTESLLIENSHELKQTVKYLNKIGVSFSIDDFGTGYSNLGYLKDFEIEILKIDRSFMIDIEHNPKNKALVTAIIQMAKGLSMKTVAEGVENLETAEMLNEMQCDYAQGYYWSKPISQEMFISFSQEHTLTNSKNNPTQYFI